MPNIFDLFRLDGKTALVTGGKNGQLGPLWVETLKSAGANVDIFDMPDYDLRETSHIQGFFYTHTEKYDILINNAGIDNPPQSESTFFGNYNEIMSVNLTGACSIIEIVLNKMKNNGGGVIVNIGSMQGYGGADWHNYPISFEKPLAYNLSKWGLRGLAKSITTQYGKYGIRCVTPSFGPYDGGKLNEDFLNKFLVRTPLGRPISKESMQMTLLYACCCPELTGVDWLVDGGHGAWA